MKMNAPLQTMTAEPDRRKYLGGLQSKRVELLNEGLVRHLYTSGMTQEEIAVEISTTVLSVRKFMKKCGIKSRVAAPRDQRGAKNANWKGDGVTYKAAHDRVYAIRGRPSKCEHCGTSSDDVNYEWANLTGNFHDPRDYIRLCRSCHCKHDGLIKNLGSYAKEASNVGFRQA